MKPIVVLLACLVLVSCAPTPPTNPQTLAQQLLIVDTHIDVPFRLRNRPDDVAQATGTGNFDYPRAKAGGLDALFMSIYIPATVDASGDAASLADELIDSVEALVADAPDKFAIATCAADIDDIKSRGLIAFPLGMENGGPIAGSFDNLRHFYDRGIRYVTLTHSNVNHISDSSYDPFKRWKGLSPFGKTLIAEMNRLGVMVDVSHVSDATFWQVIELSKAPVIASHSSVYALRDHSRNMDDELLLALKENGGVMQTVALGNYVTDPGPRNEAMAGLREEIGLPPARGRGGFRGGRGGRGGGGGRRGGGGGRGAPAQPELSDEERAEQEALQAEFERRVAEEIDPEFLPANVEDFVDHIDYAVNLIGIDHVGISSDFDGGGGIDGWDNAAETFNVTHEMVKRGYTEEEIAKVWSGNLLRVWHEVEEVAQRIQAEEGR